MIWKRKDFKAIHLHGIEDLNPLTPKYPATLALGTGIGLKTKKETLPVILTWRYRISNGQMDIFSFIAEGKYLLYFQEGENTIKDVTGFISTSFENFVAEWTKATEDTVLQIFSTPREDYNIQLAKAKEIIEFARKQNLLK